MIETNIRLVKYGTQFHLDVRRLVLKSQDVSPGTLQKACGILRRRFQLPAVPLKLPETLGLLVVSAKPIGNLTLEGDDWRAEIEDSGEVRCLEFSNPGHVTILAQLVQRCLLTEIARRTNLWPSPDSVRIRYEPDPFLTQSDISAFRRFEIAAIPISLVGLGIVVDVGTAFLTNLSVAEYLGGNSMNGNREFLKKRFEALSQRQRGQKGTLLYDLGLSKHTCYFDEYLEGVTCKTTGAIKIRGETFSSLHDYYCQKQPKAGIGADEPIARVSFRNIEHPQPVAATRLRLRVMNEALPESLKDADKIAPAERVRLIEQFWEKLGPSPLGMGRPDLETGFWRPRSQDTEQLSIPVLEFAGGKQLNPPASASIKEYKEHYRSRLQMLRDRGCWDVPADLNRVIHLAFPRKTEEVIVNRFSKDFLQKISKLTRQRLQVSPLPYSSVDEALSSLNAEPQPGMVIFVFEDESPTTYFEVDYNLRRWRVKRITYSQLVHHFEELRKGEAELKAAQAEGREPDANLKKGIGLWYSFLDMNALDIVQLLDCIPYHIADHVDYEAQLAIDVGRDKSHFALCLFICRDRARRPSFWLDTIVERMPYPQRETIPAVILRDKIIEIFRRAARRRHFDPVGSLLVLRDGREYGEEPDGIRAARDQLMNSLGLLQTNATVYMVDFHKQSMKGMRIWERLNAGATNVLEGRALFIDQKTAVMASTGAATLTQGTSEVAVMEAIEDGVDMRPVVKYAFATAQLNWSSPRVAQRLPIALQKTDQELEKRTAQEIRRIG